VGTGVGFEEGEGVLTGYLAELLETGTGYPTDEEGVFAGYSTEETTEGVY
jgi:hypothetical protein